MTVRAVRGLLAAPRRGTAGITIRHLATRAAERGRGLDVSVFDASGRVAGVVSCPECTDAEENLAVGWVLRFAMHAGSAVVRLLDETELERWDQRYRLGIPYRQLGVARWVGALRRNGWSVGKCGAKVGVQVCDAAGLQPLLLQASPAGIELGGRRRAAHICAEDLTGISCSVAAASPIGGRDCLTLLADAGTRTLVLPHEGALPLKHLVTSAILGVV